MKSISTHRRHLLLLMSVLAGVGARSAAGDAPAAPAQPLTLDAAIAVALRQNPTLKAARERIEAARGRAWQSGRWSNPALELGVEEWPVSDGGTFSDAKQTVGISQELPWPGKLRQNRALGEAAIRTRRVEVALLETEMVRDMRAAFHGVLAAEGAVAVGEDLLRIAEASTAAATRRVEAGATSYQEQLRAEIQLEQVRTEVAELRREVAAARQVLFALMGMQDQADSPLEGRLTESGRPGLLETPLDRWQPRHPSYLAAESELRRARIAERRVRLDPYPDVTASVAGGRLGETDQSIIEFGLSIPLPLLDTTKGRRTEAAAAVVEAEAGLEAVRQALREEWNKAAQRYRTAGEQAGAFRERILPRTQEALRLVQTGFEEGKFGFIDLLDTQRTFAESRLAYQRKLLELNIAQAELEALVSPRPVLDPAPSEP